MQPREKEFEFEESSKPVLKDIGLARKLATDLRQNGFFSGP
jgi:hypothetical protein